MLKNNTKIILGLSIITLSLISCPQITAYADEVGEETYEEYFVCFSNENYKEKNANKMTLVDGQYILENHKLNSSIAFYISDGMGTKYYTSSGSEMKVNETITYSYNIYFSKDKLYTEDNVEDGMYVSSSHITYKLYTPDSYTLIVNDEEKELTYNAYNTAYELYYYDEIYLNVDDVIKVRNNAVVEEDKVVYGETGKDSEPLKVTDAGYYQIKFTPGKNVDGNEYLFDENGKYGTGDDYKYNIYLEEIDLYYIVFKDELVSQYTESVTINDVEKGYRLTKDQKYPNASRYITKDVYIPTEDYKLKYEVYLYNQKSKTYKLIDDDNDEDTMVSTLEFKDVDWYQISFIDNGSTFVTSYQLSERELEDYYLVSNRNNYGFDQFGNVDIDDKYKFVKVEDDDDLYNEDYDQYLLYLTVNKADLENGNYEFYITNGKEKYKDGTNYISLNAVGTYEILFSNTHDYGRTRHYKFSLLSEDVTKEDVFIKTTNDFLKFAENCNLDARYSKNKTVYLTTDLDFANVTIPSIKVFAGTFNGCFHKLSNINIKTDDEKENVSLFENVVKNATIEKLTISNINIEAKYATYVGLVAKNYGTISNIDITGSVVGSSYVGSLAAYNGFYNLDEDDNTVDSTKKYGFGRISNCEVNVSVQGKINVGGVVGFNGGKVISSTNNRPVNDIFYSSNENIMNIGGIAGYSVGEIINSQNNAVVGYTGVGLFVGGIAGLSNGAYYYVTNNENVYGKTNVGGIVGYYTTLTNDHDYSSYFSNTDYSSIISSIFMVDDSENDSEDTPDLKNHDFTYAVNNGNITASKYAGGIAGSIDLVTLKLKNSVSDGDVSSINGSYAGGITGSLTNGEIISCLSGGTISSTGTNAGKYVGGIAGYNNGSVSYSISSSTIKGKDYLGGIIGYGTEVAKVISTYSNVLILSYDETQYAGGIAGLIAGNEPSTLNYGERVKYNYYIDTGIGGIDGNNFGSDYSDASKAVTMNELSCIDNLPICLNIQFSNDYFVGGNQEYCYPMLSNFEEVETEDNYDETIEFESLFDNYKDLFIAKENKYCRASITITYLEWDKDASKVDELDHYEVNQIQRVYYGEKYQSAPAFIHTYEKDGYQRYDASEASYFVEWNTALDGVFENKIIYASYIEVKTNLYDETTGIFVEGEFKDGTTLVVERQGDYFKLHFYYDGEEITYSDLTVKVKKTNLKSEYSAYVLLDNNIVTQDSTVYGEYICFNLKSSNLMFSVQEVKKTMPLWSIILLSSVGGAAICASGFGLGKLIASKKTKK